MRVLKFGGTSVGTVERMRTALAIVRGALENDRVVLVVSALGGVTEQLISALGHAIERHDAWRELAPRLRERHLAHIEALAVPEHRDEATAAIDGWLARLAESLEGIALLRECSPRARDFLISLGERMSVPIAVAALRTLGVDSLGFDAASLVRTDGRFGEAEVDFEETGRRVTEALGPLPRQTVAVVTGFIGSTEDGETTTLGRSGSDYTATILGGALGADVVEIWTDVDGILSADPRLVPEAFTLPNVSYREAAEMAYFGAKVLHPKTMAPVEARGVPIAIKNTFRPDEPGTIVGSHEEDWEGSVKAIATASGLSLVTVEGYALAGVPESARRIFAVLAHLERPVVMVSQASSDQSICFVIRSEWVPEVVKALRKEFATELARGAVTRVDVRDHVVVVAGVGSGMGDHPGVAGRFFGALGRARINVLALSDGASYQSVSVVLDASDARKATSVLHGAFLLSQSRVHLVLAGATGRVGSALRRLLAAQQAWLVDELNLDVRVAGALGRTRMAWDPEGIDPDAVEQALADGEDASWETLFDRLCKSRLEGLVFVDCTASELLARQYGRLLEAGVAVVTASKIANSLEASYWRDLKRLSGKRGIPYRYETVVGAGMPILRTIEDLRRSGDRIRKMTGVISGTLSFALSQVCAGMPFSEAVSEAWRRGLTESDLASDLAGEDVARKLMILVREAGTPIERADVVVEALVPDTGAAGADPQEYLAALAQYDATWSDRAEAAKQQHRRLAYLAEFDGKVARARVAAVPARSPFAITRDHENVVVFETDRYRDVPLTVVGPGAGPEIAAAGVLADIIQAAREMV